MSTPAPRTRWRYLFSMVKAADPGFHVVLVEPVIPQNTGTIGRLCVAAGATLHLVGPLGFDLDDRKRRRAGLDYWPHLVWTYHDDLSSFLEDADPSPDRCWYVAPRLGVPYGDAPFRSGDYLFFGTETDGLPEHLTADRADRCVHIPMRPEARSINLAIAAGIVLFEGLRKSGWTGPSPASFS